MQLDAEKQMRENIIDRADQLQATLNAVSKQLAKDTRKLEEIAAAVRVSILANY